MNKTSTWAIIIETAAILILSFVLFKCCNTPVTPDHKVEDSIKKVSIFKDSTYKHDYGVLKNSFDSAWGKAGFWENKYRLAQSQVQGVNQKVSGLLLEIDRLQKTGNVDSLNQAISDLKASYLSLVSLMNDISNNCDSTLLAKDTALQRARNLLSLAGIQIADVTSQRDSYARDDRAKDSVINKLQAKRKANNLWAKIATAWGTVATIISIVKK